MHILYVCTGNTCRSPMAEAITRALMRRLGMEGEVSSAGVYASEGMPASLGAQVAIEKSGGDLSGHRATLLNAGHIAEADLILGMEESHLDAVLRIAPNAAGKAFKLLDYAGQCGEIVDPFGGDCEEYLACLEVIGDAACGVLERIRAMM